MRDNIVTVYYKRSHKSTASESVWQWDSELWLRLVGFDLPPVYSVHFSNTPMDGEATEEMGDADGVPIPDYYLSTGLPVYAWLYLAGNRGGVTVYMITIPVSRRPKPTDKAIPEIKVNTIDRAIEALDGAVDEAEAAAERAEEAASSVTGVVRYNAPQGLSDEEKAQARENIGAGTGNGNGGETVVIDDYAGDVISDAILDTPIKVEVFLPKLEDVQHHDVVLRVKYPYDESSIESITIDLTVLSEPLESGWVELLPDGTVKVCDGTTYEWITLPEKVEPLLAPDRAFRIEAWADDFDLEISPITRIEYQLSAKGYTDEQTWDTLHYAREMYLGEEDKQQARTNIGAASETDLDAAWAQLRTNNSVSLFGDTTPYNSNNRGIYYEWTGNRTCYVHGILSGSGSTSNNAAQTPDGLPAPLAAGSRFYVTFASTGTKVRLQIRYAIPVEGEADQLIEEIVSETGIHTIPEGAHALDACVYVPTGSGMVDETVRFDFFTAPSNTALLDTIDNNRSEAFDILTKYNSMKLGDNISPSDSTRNGISYSWTGNSKCVVTGTLNSSNSYSNPYANVSPLPGQGLAAGGTYFIHHKSTAAKVWTRISWFVEVPGSFPRENHQDINADTFFTIPADAYNFGLDLYVPQNSGTVNETVEVGIYTAPSNLDLWNAIKALEARLNG